VVQQSIEVLKGKVQNTEFVQQTGKDLQDKARQIETLETSIVETDEKIYSITPVPDQHKEEVTTSHAHTPLESRVCETMESNEPAVIADKIDDQTTKTEKISEFVTFLNEYANRQIPMDDLLNHVFRMKDTLNAMQTFVQKNDLLSDEILMLKRALTNFSGNKTMIQCPNGSFSISENDWDRNCFDVAISIEAVEILLDAKEMGYVGLEKNSPQPTKPLGKGRYNTVILAYTEKNGKRPIALKPCHQAQNQQDAANFIQVIQSMQIFVGHASGIYNRNKATSKTQDMLVDIGKKNGITVPHIMASVFAAEMNGIPYIAMEALEGPTVFKDVCEKKNRYDNQFICYETWMQVLDILIGQIDRNSNNVVRTKNGPIAVDHDLSFPIHPPRSFASIVPTVIALHTGQYEDGHPIKNAVDGMASGNYCMPPVIDTDMYNVITKLDLDELVSMYQKCGLTRLEIEAAKARAQALKSKVEELKNRELIIDPKEWACSEKVKQLCNVDNFYALRHCARCG
jgi:hypothetical protein